MKQKPAIAVDFGGTNVRAALVSPAGKIIKRAAEETNKTGKSGAVVTKQILNLITRVLENTRPRDTGGIGIASIGPLDYTKGGSVHSPNIPYSFVPLVKPLQEKFAVPVLLLNDTNAAVLAEKRFGAGKNVENLVYITISTGIGGGAIVNSNLLLGKGGNAAEVGHMIVDTKYNILCTCKKGTGHWEGLASGTNIPRFFKTWAAKHKKSAPHFQTAKEIFREVKTKNKVALEFVDELAKVNARAISNIIVAYDPQLITLGGSVTLNNKNFIIPGIKKYVDHYLPTPRVQATALGDDISLLGAAAAVFQKKMGNS